MHLRPIRMAARAPTMAAASAQPSFNHANTGGAALGGIIIGTRIGERAIDLPGAALTLVGLGLATWSGQLGHRCAEHRPTEQLRRADSVDV